MGASTRLRARLVELLALRGAALARGRAELLPTRPGCDTAAHEAVVPAREPAALQPEVLPFLAAPLRGLRAAPRLAARGKRGTRRRGVPPVPGIAAGLALAVGSAVAIGGGYVLQHSSASQLPPLTLRSEERRVGQE